jgi:hypothetical protein
MGEGSADHLVGGGGLPGRPRPPAERYRCVHGRAGEAQRRNREAWVMYRARLALWEHERPEDAQWSPA